MRHLIPTCCILLLACGDEQPTAPPASETVAIPLVLVDFEFAGDDARALLRGPNSSRVVLPTDLCPANTTALHLDGFEFPRPLNHDLLISAAAGLQRPIVQVLLELGDGLPRARIALGGAGAAELEATIGDGLGIAQHAGVPLLATHELVAAHSATPPAGKAAPKSLPSADPLPRPKLTQGEAFVPMDALGIIRSRIVVLVDLDGKLALPIFVGLCQAISINATFSRPVASEASTHLLFHQLLGAAGATLNYGRITQLQDGIYIGEIGLSRGQQSLVLDARPSDAIALALAIDAPIEIAASLLDSVGVQAGSFIELFAAGK